MQNDAYQCFIIKVVGHFLINNLSNEKAIGML
jgi:hypothetical protein